MTFDETKEFLEDYLAQRRIAKRLMEEIAYMPVINNSLTSSITDIKIQNGTPPNLRLEVRFKEKQKQLENQIDKYLEIEDKLIPVVNQLLSIEQDVIIGYYMQGKPHYKLAIECNYCTRQIIRIKEKAIKDISELL